ncbi:hypothetical protein HMPREF3263_10485 [Haemophilus sp. HMSC61B11]|jgi:hypothetical protein|uniref:HEPN domain-containing protein n=1 Tax=Haemophilus sp. HMSC61B11 TaxID=1608882 RepID=UPI0008A89FFA|nr:HEPN domain-containing protein [Haemophilus sp. HMSC61B11]OHR63782.1 hypothetical protein HMPREF3263_10485 [Haemophilus sp. HMSC61B11]
MEQDYLLIYDKYISFLDKLSLLVSESEKRVINSSDPLFIDNVNFFSRSYLINLCTYLEAYLTEIATKLFERHCKCVNQYSVPEMFISASLSSWSVKNRVVREYSLSYSKDDIENFFDANKISGNIKKTFNVFELLGIELKHVINDKSIKDQITSIVDKRNDIIHRNDDGMDISLLDIISYINTVKCYMELIKKAVIESAYKTLSVTKN